MPADDADADAKADAAEGGEELAEVDADAEAADGSVGAPTPRTPRAPTPGQTLVEAVLPAIGAVLMSQLEAQAALAA